MFTSEYSPEQIVKIDEVSGFCAVNKHQAARLLRVAAWDTADASNMYFEKGVPGRGATAGRILIEEERPNRSKRMKRSPAPAAATAAAPTSGADPDVARATRFFAEATAASGGDGGEWRVVVVGDDADVSALYAKENLNDYAGDARPRWTLALRRAGTVAAAATFFRFGAATARSTYDGFEVIAFAVAETARDAGVGRHFFRSCCVALSASTPRRVVVINYPREGTRGFWTPKLMSDCDRAAASERRDWRAVAKADVRFFWRQAASTSLFWSEACDAGLGRCSPWFEARAATKAVA